MELTWSRLSLKLSRPFRTSKAVRTDKQTVWVKITHKDIVGWGEAAPVDTYHQTLESAEKALSAVGRLQGRSPLELDEILDDLLARFDDQRATVAAIDAALHDWIGKRFGLPVSHWLGLRTDRYPLTSYSIGIDEPSAVAEYVRQAAHYPILKIKLGTDRDEELIARVRECAPGKTLRVDANAAWSLDEAMRKLPMLARHRVELVEQPLRADDIGGLRKLREAAICPIIADESCVRLRDISALAGAVDGVNIKLSKCGGIRQATGMIHAARALGMKVMLGCMIETSLGISAAAQLAPLADWLDLDGHLLISNDPFSGLEGQKGLLRIGVGHGLGVALNTAQ